MDRKIPYPFELTTERLVIRAPQETHASLLTEAIAESLDELRPWMPWARDVPTPAEARENCRRSVRAFADGTDYRLHLFTKHPPAFIGGSGLHRIDWSVPRFEIGYWVRTSCSGHGYVTEAVREITRFALEEVGANRVEILMSTRNVRSRRVAERAGFMLEGILRNDGRHLDGTLRSTCVYARIPEPAAEER